MKPLFAVLAMTALPVSAIAETVEIDTATGPQAAPLNPAKVVALDLSAIDTLDALGVEIDGIPNITPPAYLADAFDGVATVGTLFEPDFEALAVMAPDVVFAGGPLADRHSRANRSCADFGHDHRCDQVD